MIQTFASANLCARHFVTSFLVLLLSCVGAVSKADSLVFSFGSNTFGQTGLGTAAGFAPIPAPIDATNLVGQTITGVAAGGAYNLMVSENGVAWSFGANANGRTGLGTD